MGKSQILNHFRNPVDLEDGDAVVLDARGCAYISAQAGSGATVTLSRVDSMTAAEDGDHDESVSADSFESFTVDWPYWR
ncbi:MAG: hypothetical protein ACOC9H_01090, partial [Gemmatimonadota bacterium]